MSARDGGEKMRAIISGMRQEDCSILKLVGSTIERAALIPEGARVAVALSGGPDSTFTLLALRELARRGGSFTVKALHYDHNYRPESAAEAAELIAATEKRGIEIRSESSFEPRPSSGSLAIARARRYDFFQRALDDRFCDLVATGHTLDDKIETALIWALRGAGPRAFGVGVPIKRAKIIRPLLKTRKKDILAFLDRNEIGYFSDRSNSDERFARARIRARVIPALIEEEPTALEKLARLIDLIARQAEYIDQSAEIELNAIRRSGSLGLDVDRIRILSAPIRSSLYRLAARDAGIDPSSISAERLENLDRLIVDRKFGRSLDLPGRARALVDQGGLTFSVSTSANASYDESGGFEPVRPTLPFEMQIDGIGTLRIRRADAVKSDISYSCDISIDALNSLLVRPRRAGDYLIERSMRRSLKKYLIDRRLPRRIRARYPFFARDSEIFIAPGLFVSESIRSSSAEDGALVEFEPEFDLRLKPSP